MKLIYLIITILSALFLVVVYFTNIILTQNYYIYLWSMKNSVSMATWLALIIIVSVILWASLVLFFKTISNRKVQDYEDFDF